MEKDTEPTEEGVDEDSYVESDYEPDPYSEGYEETT